MINAPLESCKDESEDGDAWSEEEEKVFIAVLKGKVTMNIYQLAGRILN